MLIFYLNFLLKSLLEDLYKWAERERENLLLNKTSQNGTGRLFELEKLPKKCQVWSRNKPNKDLVDEIEALKRKWQDNTFSNSKNDNWNSSRSSSKSVYFNELILHAKYPSKNSNLANINDSPQ